MTTLAGAASTAEVVVVGLGRIGLPLALVAADAGYVVHGLDVDPTVVNSLLGCKPLFFEPGLSELLNHYLGLRFFPTTDHRVLGKATFIVVTLSTGVISQPSELDVSGLLALMRTIVSLGLRGKVIILRSTLPLGTTDRCRELLESESGLRCGIDFHLAYAPERIVEGMAIEEERVLPKVIGAYDDAGFEAVEKFFRRIGGEIVRVSSPLAAELVKLANNAYRSTLFAFANDLAVLADALGVDVLEVISAANANYPRSHIPRPSCGVSGYCLTKDPYVLEHAFAPVASARGFGSVWYYARMTNDWMPRYTADITVKELQEVGKGTGPVSVLVAGLTFKENVDDTRYSHGAEIIRALLERRPDLKISVYDPFLERHGDNVYRALAADLRRKVTVFDTFMEAVVGQDAVVFTVPHREFVATDPFEWAKELAIPAVVVDGWNMYRSARFPNGVRYRGIGRA